MAELKEQTDHATPDQEKIEEEFGDLMFALVNLSRYLQGRSGKCTGAHKQRNSYVVSAILKSMLLPPVRP